MTHDIISELPQITPIEDDSVLRRYVTAHENELDTIDDEIDDVVVAHQVDNASGDELDRLGALFGELGRRRGRNDSDYRAYLRSVVRSFNGRGSVSGVKFAVAAAINGEPEDVTIDEDFENLEYSITLENTDAALVSSSINDLAELADPSAVELDEKIIVVDGEEALVDAQASTTSTTSGLGSESLGSGTLG